MEFITLEQSKDIMIEIYDDILKEELAKITPLDRATSALTDGIAVKIDAVMKQKGITKSQLAKMTEHRPSEVTKWLGGNHNFTCRTIALISSALGTDLVGNQEPMTISIL